MTDIGNLVRISRAIHGDMSRRQLWERTGIKPARLGKIEAGNVVARRDELKALATALGMPSLDPDTIDVTVSTR